MKSRYFVLKMGLPHYMTSTTKEIKGVSGLGTLSDHLDELKSIGANLYASGKSTQARGITKEQLESLWFVVRSIV